MYYFINWIYTADGYRPILPEDLAFAMLAESGTTSEGATFALFECELPEDSPASEAVEPVPARLAELEEVLQRPKFAQRLSLAGVTSPTLVLGYAALARLVEPVEIAPVILADPDDDAVLACAVAARAEIIVSGDSHLLDLKDYEGIPIMTAAHLLTQITAEQNDET